MKREKKTATIWPACKLNQIIVVIGVVADICAIVDLVLYIIP